MVTLSKYADKPTSAWLELYGLSTDTKPIVKFGDTYISNSSSFYCMDTKQAFLYDEENHRWLEQ